MKEIWNCTRVTSWQVGKPLPLRRLSFVSFGVNCTFVSRQRGIAAESFIIAIVSDRIEWAITRVAHLTSAADQCERALAGGHLARPRFRVGVAWLAAVFSVYADCRPRLTGCSGMDDFHRDRVSRLSKSKEKREKRDPIEIQEPIAIDRRSIIGDDARRAISGLLNAYLFAVGDSVWRQWLIFVYISRVARITLRSRIATFFAIVRANARAVHRRSTPGVSSIATEDELVLDYIDETVLYDYGPTSLVQPPTINRSADDDDCRCRRELRLLLRTREGNIRRCGRGKRDTRFN